MTQPAGIFTSSLEKQNPLRHAVVLFLAKDLTDSRADIVHLLGSHEDTDSTAGEILNDPAVIKYNYQCYDICLN